MIGIQFRKPSGSALATSTKAIFCGVMLCERGSKSKTLNIQKTKRWPDDLTANMDTTNGQIGGISISFRLHTSQAPTYEPIHFSAAPQPPMLCNCVSLTCESAYSTELLEAGLYCRGAHLGTQ